jgi:hypothetical protein
LTPHALKCFEVAFSGVPTLMRRDVRKRLKIVVFPGGWRSPITASESTKNSVPLEPMKESLIDVGQFLNHA